MTNPFLALRSFKREDAASFFGRDSDLILVQSRLFSSRCTLLFAASGVGKSSFLDAKLAPVVESQWQIVTYRSWATRPPLDGVRAAIAATAPDLDLGDAALKTQVERLIEASGRSRGCLIVLDQFEEVFQHWRDSKALDEFAGEIARLVHAPGIEARVLLTMREEFLGELSLFDNLIPDLFNNCYRLKNATRGEAEEIITRTAALRGVECGSGLDPLVDDLVGAASRIAAARIAGPGTRTDESPRSRIPMPFLQIVCFRLWQQQMMGRDAPRSGQRFLDTTPGPVRAELEAYCREKLRALMSAEQNLASAAFGFLMTRSGAKMAYPIDVLAQQAHADEKPLLAVMAKLSAEDVRILREIPGGPDSRPWFELYHDLYARFLSDWKREYDALRERQRSWKSGLRFAAGLIVVALGVAAVTRWQTMSAERRRFAGQLLHLAADQRAPDGLETPLSIRLLLESFVRDRDLARPALEEALQGTLLERVRVDVPDADLIAVSPNGQILCVVTPGGIALRRLPDNTPIGVVDRQALVSAIAFSPDSASIAAVGWDGRLEILSTSDAKPTASIDVITSGLLGAVTYSHDGRLIAVSGDTFDDTRHIAQVYRIAATATPLATVEHKTPVSVIAFSPDLRYLGTGSEDGTSRLTDLQSGKATDVSHQTKVVAAAFRPDSRMFATASVDGIVQTTVVPAGPSAVLTGDTRLSANALTFSPQGRYLATGQGVLWDLSSSQGPQLGTVGSLNALAFTRDDRLLAAAGSSGAFLISTASLRVLAYVSAGEAVRMMTLGQNGDWIAIGVGNTVRVLRIRPEASALPGGDGELESLGCTLAGSIGANEIAKSVGPEPALACRGR